MQIRFHQFIHSLFLSLTLTHSLKIYFTHSHSSHPYFVWHIHHIRLTWRICVGSGGQYKKKCEIAKCERNKFELPIQYSRGLVNFMTVTITAPMRDIFNFTILILAMPLMSLNELTEHEPAVDIYRRSSSGKSRSGNYYFFFFFCSFSFSLSLGSKWVFNCTTFEK